MRLRAVAVLLILLLLPSLATADHVFSHRYLVYGRVVDAEARPVPGVHVRVSGFDTTDPCRPLPGTSLPPWTNGTSRDTTDANGTFALCFHVHGVDPGAAHAFVIDGAGRLLATRVTFLDDRFRASFLQVVVDERGVGEPAPATVVGRVLHPVAGGAVVEGIPTAGDVGRGANVTVTFHEGNRVDAHEVVTNGLGDLAAVSALRAPTWVRAVSENVSFAAYLDHGFAGLRLSPEADLGLLAVEDENGTAWFDAPETSPRLEAPAGRTVRVGFAHGASEGWHTLAVHGGPVQGTPRSHAGFFEIVEVTVPEEGEIVFTCAVHPTTMMATLRASQAPEPPAPEPTERPPQPTVTVGETPQKVPFAGVALVFAALLVVAVLRRR